MQNYLDQLQADIAYVTANVSRPFAEKELHLHDWISDQEEEKIAPVRDLEDWTSIKQEMLPPQQMLSDEQVASLLQALTKMLDACNWHFVLQIAVPERIQYETIRVNFNQPAKVKRWHMGFFEICRPGTEHNKCALGKYCQCALFAGLYQDMIDEELTPGEERARELEIEVEHLKKKHGDDWMKYYPYHLDKNYDDEKGNPHDYGLGGEEDEDNDNWWRG